MARKKQTAPSPTATIEAPEAPAEQDAIVQETTATIEAPEAQPISWTIDLGTYNARGNTFTVRCLAQSLNNHVNNLTDETFRLVDRFGVAAGLTQSAWDTLQKFFPVCKDGEEYQVRRDARHLTGDYAHTAKGIMKPSTAKTTKQFEKLAFADLSRANRKKTEFKLCHDYVAALFEAKSYAASNN